jgi:hypothetical protein
MALHHLPRDDDPLHFVGAFADQQKGASRYYRSTLGAAAHVNRGGAQPQRMRSINRVLERRLLI